MREILNESGYSKMAPDLIQKTISKVHGNEHTLVIYDLHVPVYMHAT